MKKIILATTIAGATLLMSACGFNEPVVTVGGEKVQKEELYQELKRAYGKDVLSRVVENHVLDAKYDVKKEDIDKEIKTVKGNFATEEEFQSVLKQMGINNDEELNEYIENTLLRFEAISDGVKVTDKQLEEFLTANKDSYKTIEASHILVETKEEANNIKEKLNKGEDFKKLAQEFSKDGSAANGGSLGEFGKGQMVAEFEEVAFSLKKGEISDIVKTEFGYHIIKIDKINEKTLKTNKEDIRKDYLVQNGNSFAEVMIKLMKDTKIESKDEAFKNIADEMIQKYEMTLQSEQTVPQGTPETKEQPIENK